MSHQLTDVINLPMSSTYRCHQHHCQHFLDMPAESTIERICYRSTDPNTGIRYHQFYDPPPSTQIAMRLIQKHEDQEEYVKNQIEEYNNNLPGKILVLSFPFTAEL